MSGHKLSVKLPALFLKHTGHHLDSGIKKLGHSASSHFSEGIECAYYDTRNPIFDNHIGTWRCFPVMGTRFKGDIHRRIFKQIPVFDRSHSIDLGMAFAATAVPALPYYPA